MATRKKVLLKVSSLVHVVDPGSVACMARQSCTLQGPALQHKAMAVHTGSALSVPHRLVIGQLGQFDKVLILAIIDISRSCYQVIILGDSGYVFPFTDLQMET